MKIKRTAAERIGHGIIIIILTLFAFACIYPFWHVLMYSISDSREAMTGGLFLIPRSPTLLSYSMIFKTRQIYVAYSNTILRTFLGTLLSVFLTALTAFPLSLKRMRGRQFFSMLIFFTMLFNGGLIPTFLVVQELGLIDTFLALILPSAMSAYNMFILRNYFQQIPESLEESAYAGHIAMLGRNTNGYKKQDLPYFRFHLAQAVLFGQQMGWINADVVDDPQKMPFLKEMTGLRWKFRDFFSQGDMLRPPVLEGDNPRFLTDTGMGYPIMFDAETLLAGAWRLRGSGEALIMMMNVGDAPQNARFAFDWRAASAAYDGARQVYGQGSFLSADEKGIACQLPPHSCVALLAPQARK